MNHPISTARKSAARENFTNRGIFRIESVTVGRNIGVASCGTSGVAATGVVVAPLACAVCRSLAPSLGIGVLDLAHGLGQVHTRLVEPIERIDLVGVRPCQGILRGNDLDVCGHSGGEAALSLRYFVVRKLEAKIRYVDVLAGRTQLVDCRLYFANDGGFQ